MGSSGYKFSTICYGEKSLENRGASNSYTGDVILHYCRIICLYL